MAKHSTANDKLTREAFLKAATSLHEDQADSGALGLGLVWIRELTARQRLDIQEAAQERNAEGEVMGADEGLYRALIIQASLIDGPGGDPVLTMDDVPRLAEKGRDCLRLLATAALNLSWLTEADLCRFRASVDGQQPDSDASTTEAGAEAPSS